MAKKNPKRRGSRAYLADFQKTASGTYVYTGATYVYAKNADRSRRRTLQLLWLWCAVLVAGVLVPGCVPAGGMLNCAYVILPFSGELICAVCTVWAVVRLSVNRDPLREYVYRATVEALPRRAVATAIFAAAACVGEIVFVLLHTPGSVIGWLLAAWMAITAAASLLLRRTIRAAKWNKIKQ